MGRDPWNEKLYQRALRRTSGSVARYGIWFSIAVGVAAAAIGLIVEFLPADDGMMGDVGDVMSRAEAQVAIWGSLLAVVVVVGVLFVVQVVRAHLDMLYEVRREVGRLLDPGAAHASEHADYRCEIYETAADPRLVLVRVTNDGATGRFRARVSDLVGARSDHELPWDIRWRDHPEEREVRIASGDAETLEVVSVRSATRLEFSCPTAPKTPDGVVRISCLEPTAGCDVRANVAVFNEAADPVVLRQFALSIGFAAPGEPPLVDFVARMEPPSA